MAGNSRVLDRGAAGRAAYKRARRDARARRFLVSPVSLISSYKLLEVRYRGRARTRDRRLWGAAALDSGAAPAHTASTCHYTDRRGARNAAERGGARRSPRAVL